MDRYSKILNKDKREIVLLIGNGCKWQKCKFCNYYLDRTRDEEKQLKINKEEDTPSICTQKLKGVGSGGSASSVSVCFILKREKEMTINK